MKLKSKQWKLIMKKMFSWFSAIIKGVSKDFHSMHCYHLMHEAARFCHFYACVYMCSCTCTPTHKHAQSPTYTSTSTCTHTLTLTWDSWRLALLHYWNNYVRPHMQTHTHICTHSLSLTHTLECIRSYKWLGA